MLQEVAVERGVGVLEGKGSGKEIRLGGKNRRILQKGSQYQRSSPGGHIGGQKSAGGVAGNYRRATDDFPE